jgi:excisionase family DNA binding protein
MTSPPPADRWMTVGEAAHTLGMSRTTLLAAEEAGLLTPMRTPGGHRRYSAGELDRYLRRSGAAPLDPPATAPPRPDPEPTAAGLVAAVRGALRPVARAVAADSAALYLRDEPGPPRFTAAFGVPRWLAERLAAAPAPPAVVDAVATGRPQLFDAARAAFPEPRSTGHGAAVALPHGHGALVVLRPVGHELLPGELRLVESFGELIAAVVADQRRIAVLEQRLARIAALSGPDLTPR